ncbi:serine/threonine-protein kinase meng-po [Anabrus simplex]|uniref:serine/threonine-protein kinase meng-po n=1 Tax=Anabrus simplex TaxID=316456 RepID=UPI0035A28EF7
MRGGTKRGESQIHRVQEVTLEDVELDRDYDVLRTLGEGCFARVLLATHRRTDTTVVLKAIHSEMTSVRDFYREFHYSYHLSPHPNILSVYCVAFRSEGCYVFAQEFAPCGDLAGNVKAGGLPEEACKRIAQQLASALEFLHSKELVHRDLKLENVLVFAPDMSKIKLCDFGETRRDGTLVSRVRCTWQAFLPPEVCEIVSNERYLCRMSSDCWQLGIIMFVCLTGCPPWQAADSISDSAYCNFSRWQKRRTTKLPAQFKRFSTRLLRLFRRLLEHKAEKRASVEEVNKYLKDTWLSVKSATSSVATGCGTVSSGCRMKETPSPPCNDLVDESKCRLKKLLGSYGLETTVDQKEQTGRENNCPSKNSEVQSLHCADVSPHTG